MKRTPIFMLMFLASISTKCNESKRSYQDSDLSFFNLKGKVKTFAEINVGIGLSATANFETYAKQQVNYYEHYFSEKGELTKIENISPSPYAINGFKISFYRDSNQLIISQDSPKEKYTRTYSKKGDTLNLEVYNKISDANIYNSEKYRKFVSLKKGQSYLMNGFFEGVNRNEVFDYQEYATVENHAGDDSLIYLRQNQDSILIYSLNYLEYDKKGNWITRQFIKNKQFQGPLISYTLYRKIKYYD